MNIIKCKTTVKTDVSGPLLKYLKRILGKNISEATKNSIEEIQKQRETITSITKYTSNADINELKCYLSYLLQLEKKFPLRDGKTICINWTWYDSFSGKKYTSNDIAYERAAVLFNIGALYTESCRAGYCKDERTLELLEGCQRDLMNAAFCFHSLNKEYTLLFTGPTSDDLSRNALQTMEDMIIAQGQHLVFLKSKAKGHHMNVFIMLQKATSDLYLQVKEDSDKCGKYFPFDLRKHFEAQSMFCEVSWLHYYGQTELQKVEGSSDAGVVLKIGQILSEKMKALYTLITSFHTDADDQSIYEDLVKITKEDIDAFNRAYRIYGGICPDNIPLPSSVVKMKIADDFELTGVPLTIVIPEDTDCSIAVAQFQREAHKLIDSVNADCKKANHELESFLSDYLLPEILTAEGFNSSIPSSIRRHIEDIQGKGSVAKQKETLGAMQKQVASIQEVLGVLKSQIEKGSPFLESITWAGDECKTINQKIKDADKSIVVMTNKPIIFQSNIQDLIKSLPSCPNYPVAQASIEVRNAYGEIERMMNARRDLIIQMKPDYGESIVRNAVKEAGNLLTLQNIIFQGMAPLTSSANSVKTNIDGQKPLMNVMKKQYLAWNRKRTVTKDMQKREECLKDVNSMLKLYDETAGVLGEITEAIEIVNKSIDNVKVSLNIQ